MFMRTFLTITIAACLTAAVANSQTTTTNLVVTPSSPVFDCKNIVGVPQDAAPGFPFGSFASTGGPASTCRSGGPVTDKTDMYFTPESLFAGRSVTLGDVASISYWTKKGTTHAANVVDWFINIYTKRYPGQTVSFYGARIGAEPYLAANVIDPANTWNQWGTGGPTNELRFFESTYSYFGATTDPDFATFVAGNSLAGSHGPSAPYAPQPIEFFSIQTSTSGSPGFTGQVDGVRIQLQDGSVATINFEPFVVATDKDACKSDGWKNLFRADGSAFKNQGDCIQYVNTGK